MRSLDDSGYLLSSLLGNLLAPRVPLAAPDISCGSFDTRTGASNISLDLAAV